MEPTVEQIEMPAATLDERVIAPPIPVRHDDKTCGTCKQTKHKSVFCRAKDWPSPDSPLCQKCRYEARLAKGGVISRGGLAQRELLKFSTPDLIALHDDVLGRTLQAIGQRKLEDANAKDLAIVAKNILMNKQLLEEKPTQIIDTGQRENMRRLLDAIREEEARRNKTIDVTPMEAQP